MVAMKPFGFMDGNSALRFKSLKEVVEGTADKDSTYTKVKVVGKALEECALADEFELEEGDVLVSDWTGFVIFQPKTEQIDICSTGAILLLSKFDVRQAEVIKIKLAADEISVLWHGLHVAEEVVGGPPALCNLNLVPLNIDWYLGPVAVNVVHDDEMAYTRKAKITRSASLVNVRDVNVCDTNGVHFVFEAVGKEQIAACKNGALLGLEGGILRKEDEKCCVRLSRPPAGRFQVLFPGVNTRCGSGDFSGYWPAKLLGMRAKRAQAEAGAYGI